MIKQFYKGTSRNIIVRVTDKNGVAKDLDGTTFIFTMRDRLDNPNVEIIKTVTTHLEDEGLTMFRILPADTEDIPAGTYFIDIDMIDKLDNKTKIIRMKKVILEA